MQRFHAEDGYLGYIGIMAALLIAAFLMVSSLKVFKSETGGGGGGVDDARAQIEVQHAFKALVRCAGSAGVYDGCADRIIENEPTLAPAASRIKAATSGKSAQVSVTSSLGNTFTIALDRGAVIRSCTKLGVGACPASGRW